VTVRFWIALSLLATVGACSLPRPWLAPAQTDACIAPPDSKDPLLTISFRLPDCRQGRLIKWSYYRSEQPQFSTTDKSLQATAVSSKDWQDELDRRVAVAGKAPVIYIHGYFNSQDDAHRRALGLRALLCPPRAAADRQAIDACNPTRPIVALTWPSHVNFAKYTWDEANAEWVIEHAVAQILAIARRHEGTILVAHSMGNRILLAAALAASQEPQLFKHLVLAAPDVDRARIAELLQREVGLGFPATIYASRRDQALSASWRTHGYPRAGDLSRWVSGRDPAYPYKKIKKAHVVDTTDLSAGPVAHAAFIETKEGAADLCRVLAGLSGDDLMVGRTPDPRDPRYMLLIRNRQGTDDCARIAPAAARIAKG
jgi:esterase/lipase superfamily enzyme